MKHLTALAAGLACGNPGCTNPVERRARGRQRRFCSNDCRVRAHRISLQEAPKVATRDARGTPDNSNAPAAFPSKNGNFVTSKINGLQTPPSTIYRGGIQGPKSAVQAELIDARKWAEVTSSKGIKSFVSRIAKPALRDGGAS
jgi:hypothetical protein